MGAPSVVLATCRELPHLDADEVHLVDALKRRSIEHSIAAWDAGDEPFVDAKLAVIRSTWDYTERVDEFVAWASRVEAELKRRGRGGGLFNPASVVKWNTHKRYLVELERERIAIVPTQLVKQGTSTSLREILQTRGWTKGAVVKPAVSAGSRDTVRVRELDVDGTGQALLDAQLPRRDMLIQPYVAGIARGELSLIYVDGALSHAVNKRPRSEDFRSQPEFGSHVERVEPTAEQKRAADAILEIVGGQLLYGRVDFVAGDDGKPWLMELELVEPSLYLAYDDKSADKLAAAIARRL